MEEQGRDIRRWVLQSVWGWVTPVYVGPPRKIPVLLPSLLRAKRSTQGGERLFRVAEIAASCEKKNGNMSGTDGKVCEALRCLLTSLQAEFSFVCVRVTNDCISAF